MATYAAKTGTQNFSDTWALVDATSANLTEGSATSFTATTTSYVACTAFTPGAITIDGIGIYIARTSLQTTTSALETASISGTFSVRLAQAGNTVANTEITVNAIDLAPLTNGGKYGVQYEEITDKIGGGWVFFKFGSAVTLLAATAYTLDVKSSVLSTISCGTSSGSNWMRYLRTTSTGTPAATDRLLICGEISSAGVWSTNTVNHDSTDSSTSYGRVDIGAYGSWIWNNAGSTNYYFKTSNDIRVGSLGKLQIGTLASPIPATSTATIEFVSGSAAGCYLYCSRKSTVTMTGATKTHLGYLQSAITGGASGTAQAATTATVSSSKSSLVDPGWKNGDSVVFSATPTDAVWSNHYSKTDTVTLTADSASGVLVWTTSANYLNTTQTGNFYPHDTFQPWVVNLTRNVKIRGASKANTFQFTVNTDLCNLTSVEIFFVDALHLAMGDYLNPSKIKNCVVRECRSAAISGNTAAGGIVTRGARNLIVEDCVVNRGSGICAGVANSIDYSFCEHLVGMTVLFKNCVSINNHDSAFGPLGNNINGHPYAVFDGCITNATSYGVKFGRSGRFASVTNFINCEFGLCFNIGYFQGPTSWGDAGTSGSRLTEGEGFIIVKNCNAYANSISMEGTNIRLESCTFTKNRVPSSNNDYFLHLNAYSTTNNSSSSKPSSPVFINNCTFNNTTNNSNGTVIYWGYGGYAIFNGGSTNTTGVVPPGHYGFKCVFNNFSCPNWVLPTINNASTDAAPTGVAWYYSRESYAKFQKFNQVEGDHRVYSGHFTTFSDSTIYDSSPRSLKVYSTSSVGGGILNPIRIPLKKNQSATVKVKVKLSEPNGTYNTSKFPKQFIGKTPSLLIRASSGLGSSYDNDLELYASSDLNGVPSPSDFTPTSLGSNCKLWLDCTSLSNFTYDYNYRTVSQWNDQSGSGNHLTQSTDAKKPFIKLSDSRYGGYPLVLTGASFKDQRLVSSGNILGGSTSEMDMFVIVSPREHSYGGDLFGFNGATTMYGIWSPINRLFHTFKTDTSRATTTSGVGIGISNNNESGLVNDGLFLIHLRNSVVNSKRRINLNGVRGGSAYGSGYSGTSDAVAVNITPTNFSLGVAKESGTGEFNKAAQVDVFEVVVINKYMSDTEVDNMNKYLCNKWDIALNSITTTWKTLTYNIPAVTDDTVVEAAITVRGNYNLGWVNIDSITVT